jgi:hypothetical protein
LSTKNSDQSAPDLTALLAAGYEVKLALWPDDMSGGCRADVTGAGTHSHGFEWAALRDRIILLNHIARAYPDMVEAGFALIAEWRAESAERRRKALRRREHDKRRRRRAKPGSAGGAGRAEGRPT